MLAKKKAFLGQASLYSTQARRQLFVWPRLFFNMNITINKRLLRAKKRVGGGACLYMSQDGHWLASFEAIRPPKKVSFPAAKK